MPQRGLTLLELLITLVILSLLLTIGLPGFQRQIQETRTLTMTQTLQDAVQMARQRAVSRNGRVSLRPLGDWERGWELFDDENHNGVRDDGEHIVLTHRLPPDLGGLTISGNQPMNRAISYIGTGESRHASGTPLGGFQAGRLTICSPDGSFGYELVLARMGRMRRQMVDAEKCTD